MLKKALLLLLFALLPSCAHAQNVLHAHVHVEEKVREMKATVLSPVSECLSNDPEFNYIAAFQPFKGNLMIYKTFVNNKVKEFKKRIKDTGLEAYVTGMEEYKRGNVWIKFLCKIEVIRTWKLAKTYVQDAHWNFKTDFRMTYMPHLVTSVLPSWYNLKRTGHGIKVAIIDSGIPFLDPMFAKPGKSCPSYRAEGCRVDIVRSLYNPCRTLLEEVRVDSNYDPKTPVPTMHGTSIAHLIGGLNRDFPGVAPGVTFLDYRIVGPSQGSAQTCVILKAIETAIFDGADIINVSMGTGQMESYALLKDFATTGNKNIFLSVAWGSDAEGILFDGDPLASMNNAFAAASFENPFTEMNLFEVSLVPGEKYQIQFCSEEKLAFNVDFPFSVAYESSMGSGKLKMGNDPLMIPKFLSKAVLLECYQKDQCNHLYNGLKPYAPLAFLFPELTDFTCVDAKKLDPNAIFAIVPSQVALLLYEGPRIEYFTTIKLSKSFSFSQLRYLQPSQKSSIGPSLNLRIKPDFSTIGDNVPVYRGEGKFELHSGTSITAAMTTGILALYLEHFQNVPSMKTPFEVKNRLQNTATPVFFNPDFVGIKETANPEHYAIPVAQQGAGILNAYHAMEAKITAIRPKIEFLDFASIMRSGMILYSAQTSHFDFRVQKLVFRNKGLNPVRYTLRHYPAASLIPNFKGGFSYGTHAIEFKPDYLSDFLLSPNDNELMLTARILRNTPDFLLLSGFLILAPQNTQTDLPTISIPYQMMTGDFQQYPLFPLSPETSAFLCRRRGAIFPVTDVEKARTPENNFMKEDSIVYTFVGDDVPLVYMYFGMRVRLVIFKIKRQNQDKKQGWREFGEMHRIEHLGVGPHYFPKKKGTGNEYGWDGKITVPLGSKDYPITNGDYDLIAVIYADQPLEGANAQRIETVCLGKFRVEKGDGNSIDADGHFQG